MKRKTVEQRAREFAVKNEHHARRVKDTGTGIFEYLQFAYARGWSDAQRRARYAAQKEVSK